MDYTEYLEKFSDNVRDSLRSEHIESINADIDKGIASSVRRINEETGFETISSCSGFVADHFDITGLREDGVEFCEDPAFRLAFDEVTPDVVSISIVDEFHSIQSESDNPQFSADVLVDGEFYELQDAFVSVGVEIGENTIAFPVTVQYNRRVVPQWVTVTVDIDTQTVLEYVDSFDEYDAVIESYVLLLEKLLCNYQAVINDELEPSYRYNLFDGRWVSKDEASTICPDAIF